MGTAVRTLSRSGLENQARLTPSPRRSTFTQTDRTGRPPHREPVRLRYSDLDRIEALDSVSMAFLVRPSRWREAEHPLVELERRADVGDLSGRNGTVGFFQSQRGHTRAFSTSVAICTSSTLGRTP